MANLTFNVAAIVIGVLIVRIIIAWFTFAKYYIESRITINPDQAIIDHNQAIIKLALAIPVTLLASLIIVSVLLFYQQYANSQ